MSKKTTQSNPQFQVGDLVAWESQAAGSWRTKIGKIVALPKPGEDLRTSASKVRIKVLASYPLVGEKDVGKAKGAIQAKTAQAEGRASIKILRTLTDAELAAVIL